MNGMEAGHDPLAAAGSGSQDLQKPLLLKSEGSSKPRSSHHGRHHHHHNLRSRRDAVLPNSGFAIFSTLVVALGPLSLGFAVRGLVHMVWFLIIICAFGWTLQSGKSFVMLFCRFSVEIRRLISNVF